MSRRESDREDLLREATALVERMELVLPTFAEPVVAGFRRDGAASLFFGADPVYQFNAAGELRRAYLGGVLYKAESGRLVALRRQRSATEVALIRSAVDEAHGRQILADLAAHLTALKLGLERGDQRIIGQVPADAPLIARLAAWLAALPAQIAVARVPNVR